MNPSFMTVEEYVNLEPCGSIHPDYPNIICNKHGKCGEDWHSTTYTNPIDKFTAIVQWGKDLESFLQEFGGPITGQLWRITD